MTTLKEILPAGGPAAPVTKPGMLLPGKSGKLFRRVPRLAVAIFDPAPDRNREVRDTLREILAQLETDPSAASLIETAPPTLPVRPRLRTPFLLPHCLKQAA